MRITGGQVFDLEQGFVSRDVCFDGEKLELSSADGKTYDASGCYVIPGLTVYEDTRSPPTTGASGSHTAAHRG